MDIQILDEKHNLINFNNIDWSLLLCFYITRQNVVSINPVPFNSIITNNLDQKSEQSPLGKKDETNIDEMNDLNFLSN